MKKNLGTADKIIRVLLAVLFAVLIFAKVVTGWLAIVLGILAAAFLINSIIGFCPLYVLFKINTTKKAAEA